MVRIAEGLRSFAPDVATITGSTTKGGVPLPENIRTTSRMIAVLKSIPDFTALGGSSAKTASICRRTIFGVAGWMPKTPLGFCAVRQVMAVVPWTPRAEKTFRSAWMPAPPPLSDPAMVSARGRL